MTIEHQLRLDSAEPAPVARWRVDVATVRKVETTPVGGRRVEAGMVRRGQVLEYRRADGSTVRELVSPEAASASVQGAAVTVGHPDTGLVTPETFKRDSVGIVIGDVRFDGDLAVATFDVNDADAVRRIDSGELREVSLGYRAMVVDRPGTSASGARYDAVQVGRVVNHAALLPRGGARAGREAALRMDGAAVQVDAAEFAIGDRVRIVGPPHMEGHRTGTIQERDGNAYGIVIDGMESMGVHRWYVANELAPVPPNESSAPPAGGGMGAMSATRSDAMETERIDGIDYKVGSPEWRQAKAKFAEAERARLDAADRRVKELEAEVTKQTARADAAERRVKELETELTPARLDARVAERTALIAKVRPVIGPEVKLDGKSELEIMLLALAKIAPEFKADAIEESQRAVHIKVHFDAHMKYAAKPSPLDQARMDALPNPAAPAAPWGAPAPVPGGGAVLTGAPPGADPTAAFMPRLDDLWRHGPRG